jgi:hypothetical protein
VRSATSTAEPRLRTSTAPTPRSRSTPRRRLRFQGREASTRRSRPKGVRRGSSAERKAIRGSSFQASPSSRASSSTSPARVTAGLGSSRKAPGGRHRTGGPAGSGEPRRGAPVGRGAAARVQGPGGPVASPAPGPGPGPGNTVARRVAVASDGDHRTASLSSRRSASSSTSQPGGTRPRGRPGAALIPTPPTRSPNPRHQASGGRLSPAGRRRPAARRAGSANTASDRPRRRSRTSARAAATTPAPWTRAFSRAMRRCTGSRSTARATRPGASAHRSPPIPQHRSATTGNPA